MSSTPAAPRLALTLRQASHTAALEIQNGFVLIFQFLPL